MNVLFEATDYAELVAGLEARSAALGISRLELDHLAGLPTGYAGKVFAPVPVKGLGKSTLGPVLGALACKIVVVQDDAMLERMAKRYANMPHAKPRLDANGGMPTLRKQKKRTYPKLGSDWGRVMRMRGVALSSTFARRASAKHAAESRWRAVRALVKEAKPDITRVKVP